MRLSHKGRVAWKRRRKHVWGFIPRYKVEADWRYQGYRCVVLLNHLGHRCGYVALPKGHMLWGLEYGTLEQDGLPDFDVHGGLTYSSQSPVYPVPYGSAWWLGYDCGHCNDSRDRQSVEEVWGPIPVSLEGFYSCWDFEGSTLKTTGFVEKQCEDLVDQILEVCHGKDVPRL